MSPIIFPSLGPTLLLLRSMLSSKVLPLAAGAILLFEAKQFKDPLNLIIAIVALVLIVSAFASELFSYLQLGRISSISIAGVELELTHGRELASDIEKLRQEVLLLHEQQKASEAEWFTRVFTPAEKEELKCAVVERLKRDEISSVLAEIESKLLQGEQQRAALASLWRLYDGVISSLQQEIVNLGRRANVNLVMGSIITLIGLSILGYFVLFAAHPSLSDNSDFALYLGTRITLVVFIEVFAYFFLRLYRYSLFEIKYFQNEVTNARFKIVAIEVSLQKGSSALIDRLCMELAKTERNFILKKGETTLSLRRDELEQISDSTVSKLFERFLQSGGSSKTGNDKPATT